MQWTIAFITSTNIKTMDQNLLNYKLYNSIKQMTMSDLNHNHEAALLECYIGIKM